MDMLDQLTTAKPKPKPIPSAAQVAARKANMQKPGAPSNNPGGRPKGVAAYIREKTKDGKEIVDFMLQVLRGELGIERYTMEGIPYKQYPTVTERQNSAYWLADRGFGKVSADVEGVNSRLVLVNLFFNEAERKQMAEAETPQHIDVLAEPIQNPPLDTV